MNFIYNKYCKQLCVYKGWLCMLEGYYVVTVSFLARYCVLDT